MHSLKIAFKSLLVMLAIAFVAIAAQQYRYLETRRDVVAFGVNVT